MNGETMKSRKFKFSKAALHLGEEKKKNVKKIVSA